MTYWLTNVYCANAVVFDAGFILVQDFLRGFNPNLMIGFSFNRYYHPQNDPNPRFEFRCNFSDDTNGKSEAERRLNSFITNGRISRFTGWVPFQRREDVVKSAEIASSWSLAFFEHLSQNQNTSSDFNSDRMMFLTRFIPGTKQSMQNKYSLSFSTKSKSRFSRKSNSLLHELCFF